MVDGGSPPGLDGFVVVQCLTDDAADQQFGARVAGGLVSRGGWCS